MDAQKLSLTAILIASSLFISACEEPAPTVNASTRPVKTVVVGESHSGDTRTFPAIVDAIQKADISFRVGGKISKILVKEGDEVKKGQLLAELDTTDFNIKLKDREASYATAKANFERAKELVGKGAISRVEHDDIRARYHTAKANLNEAKQDLIYTRLRANFDGYIAKRYLENFEEVLGSQKIFALEDVSALKIIIDVPENLMISLNKKPDKKRIAIARFNNIKDVDFPLEFVEATTKADAATKTFKVTMKMDAPEDYNVLPGMTATVFAQLFPEETSSASTMTVPVSAVIADNDKQATVWVVNEETMTVSPKSVEPGLIIGDSMQVSGLEPGERIVIAGASFLRDDMKVSLLETGEQPE